MLLNQNKLFYFLRFLVIDQKCFFCHRFFENHKHRYCSTLAISTNVCQIVNSFQKMNIPKYSLLSFTKKFDL